MRFTHNKTCMIWQNEHEVSPCEETPPSLRFNTIMGSCGKSPHLCNCKNNYKKKGKVRLRYVGNPKPTQVGQEYGRKRDGLEKKPRSTLPVGLRFK